MVGGVDKETSIVSEMEKKRIEADRSRKRLQGVVKKLMTTTLVCWSGRSWWPFEAMSRNEKTFICSRLARSGDVMVSMRTLSFVLNMELSWLFASLLHCRK